MENFDLIHFDRHILQNEEFKDIRFAENTEGKIFFIDSTNTLYEYDYKSQLAMKKLTIPESSILLVKYLRIDRVLCIVMHNQILIYHTLDEKVNTFTTEKDILTVSWDLFETKLLILHSDGEINLYLFNSVHMDWFKSATTNISEAVPNSVQVGWGSEVTQFRGKKRKPAHQETNEFETPNEILNKPPVISWRDNNREFAVNFSNNGHRCIKVFDDSCKPLFENNSYTGLQHQLSFSSAGYIACISKNPKNTNNSLVIFERNCKERYNFALDDVQGDIISVELHKEFNTLIIHSQTVNNDYITIFNYYCGQWFLKQQLNYPLTEHKIVSYHFEMIPGVIQSFLLYIITRKATFTYQYRIVIQSSKNFVTVGVINGKNLNLTFYEDEQIPAPLYSLTFANDLIINKIQFHESNKWCAIICESCVKVINYERNTVNVIKNIRLNEYNIALNYLQCFWHNSNLNICVKYNEIFYDDDDNKNVKLQITKTSDNIVPFTDSINYNEQFIADISTIYSTNVKIDKNLYTFSINCKDFNLKLNNENVCKDITSFLIYKNYLLVTLSNKLYCVRLHHDNITHLIDKSLSLNDFYVRSIEDGGRIVCVTQKKSEIILLLPRGNIETITCRPILIDLVENYLNESKWLEVIHLIRVHKLNANLLIDLNPQRFIDNIENFINAAKTPTVLCNLCMEFSNENCLNSLYKNCVENHNDNGIEKVEVLKLVLEKLEQNMSLYFQTVVLMKLKHLSLRNALICVLSVFKNNQNNNLALELCRKVVNKILLYTNQNDVYNESLQLYNIDFVAFIGNCCSLDPKLYEPQLDKLKLCPVEIERNYLMNVMAKNFQQAVKYLIRFEKDTDNVINFINKYNLIETAYKTCPRNSISFQAVSKLYAEQLSMKYRKYNEAGFILKDVGLYKEALVQYKRALNISQIIYLLDVLNYSETERKEIVSDLIDDLVKKNQVLDASHLCETYLRDYERSVEILLENKLYTQAITAALKYNCGSNISK